MSQTSMLDTIFKIVSKNDNKSALPVIAILASIMLISILLFSPLIRAWTYLPLAEPQGSILIEAEKWVSDYLKSKRELRPPLAGAELEKLVDQHIQYLEYVALNKTGSTKPLWHLNSRNWAICKLTFLTILVTIGIFLPFILIVVICQN